MNVTPTAGIAAAWSAAKPAPNQQAAQLASDRQGQTGQAQEAEPKKGPPAPEGQGTQVDVRV
jgi:hypothetical protein